MKLFGVDWVDFREAIDIKFHGEKLGAAFITMGGHYGPSVGIFCFIYITFFTSFYYLTILYLIWMIYDAETAQTGGRRWPFLKKIPFFKFATDYFPIHLLKEEDFKKGENYMCIIGPHGVVTVSSVGNFLPPNKNFEENFPGFDSKVAAFNGIFYIPFYREYMLMGGLISVNERSILNYLAGEKNKVISIIIGGADDLLQAEYGTFRIKIKNRKGFVRVALLTGTHLVPVIAFGENEIYRKLFPNPPGSLLYKIQAFVAKYVAFLMGYCYMVKGRGLFQKTFGLIPIKCPLHTVVGKPLYVVRHENPSQQLVDEYHAKFLNSMTELFEKYKGKYAPFPESAKLEIV